MTISLDILSVYSYKSFSHLFLAYASVPQNKFTYNITWSMGRLLGGGIGKNFRYLQLCNIFRGKSPIKRSKKLIYHDIMNMKWGRRRCLSTTNKWMFGVWGLGGVTLLSVINDFFRKNSHFFVLK